VSTALPIVVISLVIGYDFLLPATTAPTIITTTTTPTSPTPTPSPTRELRAFLAYFYLPAAATTTKGIQKIFSSLVFFDHHPNNQPSSCISNMWNGSLKEKRKPSLYGKVKIVAAKMNDI